MKMAASLTSERLLESRVVLLIPYVINRRPIKTIELINWASSDVGERAAKSIAPASTNHESLTTGWMISLVCFTWTPSVFELTSSLVKVF